jgi:hypothetical protein
MSNLPMIPEEDHIINAAREDAGFGRILSFAKGEFFLDKQVVQLGSEFRVHWRGWVKVWINFDVTPIRQMIYRVAYGEVPPNRQALGDLDQTKWKLGLNNQPKDPFVKQYLIPFESLETGEIIAFRTSSWGGRRAVSALCLLCAHKAKMHEPSVPVVRLQTSSFQTTKYGKIQQPEFVVAGWESDTGERPEVNVEPGGDEGSSSHKDFEDEVPF